MASAKAQLKTLSKQSCLLLLRSCIQGKFTYEEILSKELFDFLNNLSISKGSNIDYMFLSVITTINFILAKAKCKINIREQADPYMVNLNTFSIFVGPPNSNKSGTIDIAVTTPLHDLGFDKNIVQKPSASSLNRELSNPDNDNAVIMINSEVHELLLAKIRATLERASGDLSVLNQVYSGEEVKHTFTSRKSTKYHIPKGAVLCIVGKLKRFFLFNFALISFILYTYSSYSGIKTVTW